MKLSLLVSIGEPSEVSQETTNNKHTGSSSLGAVNLLVSFGEPKTINNKDTGNSSLDATP